MKKRIVACMLSIMMLVSATACGNSSDSSAEGMEAVESTESAQASVVAASSLFDIKGSDYVTLCDYNNIEVTIYGDYEVTDETVATYFQQMFENYGPFYKEDSTKTTVEEGDIINVDYVGKLDGTAFDGGSAEEQLIDVSGNCTADGATSYIDGFTEGLVGAKVGDVVDCAVTFPENYGNADLAGKEAVFTFTVNSIQREVAFEEVDDAFAQEQFNVDSLDAMYETLQTYLTQVSDYYKTQNTISAIQDYLVDNCQVEMPEDYLEARVADYKRAFIDANLDGDESQLEDYASTYYGYTAEELEDTWRSSMEEGIQLELIMDAIVEEMGLTVDETEYADYVSQMLSSGYYDDEDSMYEMYGCGDLEYGKTYFRNLYLYDMALDKIEETTKVSIEETEPESETEETTETENN